MRKFLFIFTFLVFSFSLCYAEPDVIDSTSLPDSPAQVVVDITSLLNSPDSSNSPDEVIVIEPQIVNVETYQQRISPSDTSGLKAVMLTLLGDYETTITDYEYRTGNSTYTSHSISIERDWSWICSCGIFAILLWCTYRAIGGILCRM